MSKVTISRKIELDYGHTLPNHFSFCNQVHGHRGVVIATVSGEVVTKDGDSSQGMVMDFKFLKETLMTKVHDPLDHGFAVWEKDSEDLDFIVKRNTKVLITKAPPTAEYLAEWAFKQLVDSLPAGIELDKVEWFETPTSCATYTKENYNAIN